MRTLEKAGFIVIGTSALVWELFALATWQGWIKPKAPAAPVAIVAPAPAAKVAVQGPAAAVPEAGIPVAQWRPEDGYYNQLRQQIRWVETRMHGVEMSTPDLKSRMLLAKSAAQRAGLHEVGLGFQDVYGIINAETTWVPRTGASKDGTPNLGIAQFEPATARALGLRNPNDLVEAVHVAAAHMKEAAEWSINRLDRLKLNEAERATKLREGVSIYYNLSSRGRSVWNGKNTARLPKETRYHIANARIGARQAILLDKSLADTRQRNADRPVALNEVPANGG